MYKLNIVKQQRYYYYIANGIDTQHVAEMKNEWLSNVLKLLPHELKQKQKATLGLLSNEMKEDYHMSVKKAIGIALPSKILKNQFF